MNEQQENTTLVVSDVFEMSGAFTPEVLVAFAELDALVGDNLETRELVRPELEMIESICTNTESSLNMEQLLYAAVFLKDKIASLPA